MAIEVPARPVVGVPRRPYRRGTENALLGGVCGGLAIRLGVRERTIRVIVVLLALWYGVGLVLYALAWLCVPRSGEEGPIAQRLVRRERGLARVVVALVVMAIVVVFLQPFSTPVIGWYTWPVLLSLAAFVGVWHGASSDERRHLSELARSAPIVTAPSSKHRTRSLVIRGVVGVALVLVGLRLTTRLHGFVGSETPAVFGTLILLAGVVVLLAPWWLTTLSELSEERRTRVRVEERAKVAAHLHDSVLQTLTLIERSAGDEATVVRLARNQERELRQWLFDLAGTAPGDAPANYTTLLHGIEREIENDYGVTIELVSVGDCVADDAIDDLIAAGREAVINAARWSGAARISVYGEVEPEAVTLFVRDRGRGFDPASVPADRKGIALSIRERLEGRGGTALVRSTPGEGTEVELRLPRGVS